MIVSNLDVDDRDVDVETSSVHWAERALVLWENRQLLLRIAAVSLVLSASVAFLLPKRYTSVTSIMPPESQNSGAMLLAALAGRGGFGALGSLANGLFQEHSTTALFITLLQSGTVADHLINRFDLRSQYHKRYYVDTAKRLSRMTKITDDKKSGVITIKVQDTNPQRARDLAQAYLDELNRLVTQTSTSAARQERIFIEQRMHAVQNDLESAQIELSDFSSRNTTVDLTAQTRAMVDVGARIEGQLVAERSSLESMRQAYSDDNMHVRQAEARIGVLQHELSKLAGTSATGGLPTSASYGPARNPDGIYPPLRQLPRLAVRYADLYRRVKIQETVFELLTQQYEMAHIEEAKDIPVVRVIDSPGVPEKKSFPPRMLLTVAMTFLCVAGSCAFLLVRQRWAVVDSADPRKRLADAVVLSLSHRRHAIALAERRVL